MAGDARIAMGWGYRFDGNALEAEELEDLSFKSYFNSSKLVLIEPFHAIEDKSFAVVTRSSYRTGDPQEWDHGYGLQMVDESLDHEEIVALLHFAEGFRREFPESLIPVSSQDSLRFGVIVSVTADI